MSKIIEEIVSIIRNHFRDIIGQTVINKIMVNTYLSLWNNNIRGNSFYNFKPFPAKNFILKKFAWPKK